MEVTLLVITGLLYVAAIPWLLSIGRSIWVASRSN